MESLPDYAKDMKLNFSSVVLNQTDLNEQQLWGTDCRVRHDVAQ